MLDPLTHFLAAYADLIQPKAARIVVRANPWEPAVGAAFCGLQSIEYRNEINGPQSNQFARKPLME
jgi:hypothetical protein